MRNNYLLSRQCAATLAASLLLPALASAQLGVDLVLDNLDQPVRLVSPPDDDRLLVVEQGGLVKIFSQDGDSLGVFLDVTTLTDPGGERGLLGLAFAPDYQESGRFYVNYTDPQGATRIARYQVSDDENVANPQSAEVILTVEQPYENHNGGHLEFGPDGMLYIGLGDGGDAGDPQERAQDPATLLGKMLRIDVSTATGYAVPADNPFVGEEPLDEIWHFGLRNPWTYAFDSETGDLYIADVGQDRAEEVDVQPAGVGGLNLGWDITEGSLCFEPADSCDTTGLTLPVFEYLHAGEEPTRCSISGGQVYRGAAITDLDGHYFFADFCSRQIWSLVWDGADSVSTVVEWTSALTPDGGFGGIASIGRDDAGELYIVDRGHGEVYRLRSDTPTETSDAPAAALSLARNTPNPFNPRTSIAFAVPHDGAHIALRVYDLAGRLVRTLVDESRAAGDHTVTWDGSDDSGRASPAGVYVYQLHQEGTTLSRRMTLVK